jgi:hypothetical protein
MTTPSMSDLVTIFSEVGNKLTGARDTQQVFETLSAIAAVRVPGAQDAGITIGRNGNFRTPAGTSDLVYKVDKIQYELETGPCVDAAIEDSVYNAADLATDPRWPEFGKRAASDVGVTSMLGLRLYLEGDTQTIASLNLYSTAGSAFDETSELIALLLATHGALAIAAAESHEKIDNLNRALLTSREIGVALGIVMQVHKITQEQAFDLLRILSQRLHRKLADIATEVAETGQLPQLPVRDTTHLGQGVTA